jgi:hypothetical protein
MSSLSFGVGFEDISRSAEGSSQAGIEDCLLSLFLLDFILRWAKN